MGMIGLETEQVSPPHEPETTFVLRTALSPYECEWVRVAAPTWKPWATWRARWVPDAIEGVFKAIDAGKAACRYSG